MPNPLYDHLVAPLATRGSTFLTDARGNEITGESLHRTAMSFAAALSGLGLQAGDRMAVQVEKTPEALALYCAAIATGIIFLPLNTAYTAAEVEYFVEDAEASLLVGDPSRKDLLSQVAQRHGARFETLDAGGEGSLRDRAKAAGIGFVPVARSGDDLAAILYTSGTTGRSKGAMLSHENLLSNARVLVDEWRFDENDVLLHALPIFHTHGLFVAINVVLLSGGSMIFLPGFKADDVISWLPRATTMMGVPTFYTRLLDTPAFTRDLTRHMRLFTSGSAPLLAETHQSFEARTGHRILERYGMTETNMNTSNPYRGDRVAGTVGLPLPGVNIRVVDMESGTALPDGETGMLEVKGPNVFKGYWNMPEKTKAEFRDDGFFITGDLGLIDERGYIHIVGRGKDLVISGGYNIYPKEIESEIDLLDGVFESAVIGLPHKDFGEGTTAVVVKKTGSSLEENQVLAALSERLARYKLPKRILFVDELPRNTMGKVQKNILRERYRQLYE